MVVATILAVEDRVARKRRLKREKDARAYIRHREKRLARNSAYYEANREAVRAQQADWRARNAASVLAYSRQYKADNREYYRAKCRDYAKNNPDKTRAYARQRRARVNGAEGSHTDADIRQLWVMQKSKCACCSIKLTKENAQVDHIVPLARGGSNAASNLQLLCAACNRSKGAKHSADFMRLKGFLL